MIYHHHEHYDGNGYPDGLQGEDIPLLSRVISVVDSYDAMTEPRSYHPKRSHHDTLAVLLHERGSKHDPQDQVPRSGLICAIRHPDLTGSWNVDVALVNQARPGIGKPWDSRVVADAAAGQRCVA